MKINELMKKHIANVITGSRAVFSLPLLLIPLSSPWFYALYFFCAFTDMIDGTVARRMGAVGKFGAGLDTAADFIFMLVCCVQIQVHLPVWLWVWVGAVAFVKLFNIALVLILRKKLISIHSVLNKITGFALFVLPLTLTFVEAVYSISAVCTLATAAAIQELCFVAKGREVV